MASNLQELAILADFLVALVALLPLATTWEERECVSVGKDSDLARASKASLLHVMHPVFERSLPIDLQTQMPGSLRVRL